MTMQRGLAGFAAFTLTRRATCDGALFNRPFMTTQSYADCPIQSSRFGLVRCCASVLVPRVFPLAEPDCMKHLSAITPSTPKHLANPELSEEFLKRPDGGILLTMSRAWRGKRKPTTKPSRPQEKRRRPRYTSVRTLAGLCTS